MILSTTAAQRTLARLALARSPSACFSTHPACRKADPLPTAPLKRTPLYPIHIRPENGARMVPFAGFEMPLTYSKSGGQSKPSALLRLDRL